MRPARPAVRPARPRPATDAPSTGYGVDRAGNLKPSRPAADIAPSPWCLSTSPDSLVVCPKNDFTLSDLLELANPDVLSG